LDRTERARVGIAGVCGVRLVSCVPCASHRRGRASRRRSLPPVVVLSDRVCLGF
jgi:hypothetical protein